MQVQTGASRVCGRVRVETRTCPSMLGVLGSELDDLGVIVDLVGLGIAIRFLVPTALSERATRGVQALAALVDGEGDSLPGFRVPKVEACDVARCALDRLAQVLHRGGIESARIETAESCNAGNHS